MNLVIDIGNTRTKIGVFKNKQIVHKEFVAPEKVVEKSFELINTFSCKNGIVASVRKDEKETLEILGSKIPFLQMNSSLKTPFINKYDTPKTLGVDRIALAAGASSKYQNTNVLVIDAGTCITYDFINAKNEYLGGGISPGLQMRYKALNGFTGKLPLLSLNKEYHFLVGNNTENSIHSGIINGVVFEIDKTIDQYRSLNKNLTVVLTGGDTFFLDKRLKNSIFANSSLLLEGLNFILIENTLHK